MSNIFIQWKRNKETKDCELYVNDGDGFKHYKQAKYYRPDSSLSTGSGFATFQVYLKKGATIIPTTDQE